MKVAKGFSGTIYLSLSFVEPKLRGVRLALATFFYLLLEERNYTLVLLTQSIEDLGIDKLVSRLLLEAASVVEEFLKLPPAILVRSEEAVVGA